MGGSNLKYIVADSVTDEIRHGEVAYVGPDDLFQKARTAYESELSRVGCSRPQVECYGESGDVSCIFADQRGTGHWFAVIVTEDSLFAEALLAFLNRDNYQAMVKLSQ